MSLLFNVLSRLAIVFLPRSKCLLISWLQSPSVVIMEPKKIKFLTVSIVSPSIWHEMMGLDAMTLVFWKLNFKPAFSLSSFTFIKRHFSSSLSAIRVVSSSYLRLLIFLLAVLTPDCASSSLAFYMMYSAYKVNKQGDHIQPWCTPFPIWNQSVPCLVLTVASWPAYRFPRSIWHKASRKDKFHLNPKEVQYQRMFKYHTFALISHSNKVMLKILQGRIQHYVNWKLQDVQVGFRKDRGTRNQIVSISYNRKSNVIPEKHLLHWLH